MAIKRSDMERKNLISNSLLIILIISIMFITIGFHLNFKDTHATINKLQKSISDLQFDIEKIENLELPKNVKCKIEINKISNNTTEIQIVI